MNRYMIRLCGEGEIAIQFMRVRAIALVVAGARAAREVPVGVAAVRAAAHPAPLVTTLATCDVRAATVVLDENLASGTRLGDARDQAARLGVDRGGVACGAGLVLLAAQAAP